MSGWRDIIASMLSGKNEKVHKQGSRFRWMASLDELRQSKGKYLDLPENRIDTYVWIRRHSKDLMMQSGVILQFKCHGTRAVAGWCAHQFVD